MKLNTIVPDIYKHLEGLSDGKPLPLTEEDIDNTLVGIKEALMSWAVPSDRNKDFTVRMSNVGKRSEEHTSELQSPCNLVCRLLLEKKKKKTNNTQVKQAQQERYQMVLLTKAYEVREAVESDMRMRHEGLTHERK